MKMLVITTDNVMSIRDYNGDYREIGEIVGGYIEIVRPRRLPQPFCMVVNEEGMLLNLPVNMAGSLLYGTDTHGYPIYGDIAILQEGIIDGEPDIIGILEEEAVKLGVDICIRLKTIGELPRWENETERNKQS